MAKQHVDHVTGDKLTTGEYISWLIQGIIRRWTFLILITVVTALVWLTNNPTALLWWNLGASYMALFIESIVGLAMFNQTRRDAVALRETRAISQHVEKAIERLENLELLIDQHVNMTAREHLEALKAMMALTQEIQRYTSEVHTHTRCTGHTVIVGLEEVA